MGARLARVVTVGRRFDEPRGARLRQAFERLGPIFVKFGQVLSTRRDMLPLDVAEELAKLQDRVPPFPGEQAVAMVERAFGAKIDVLFAASTPHRRPAPRSRKCTLRYCAAAAKWP